MTSLKEQFIEVRNLITQYRYDEALDILYDIDHPKADQWIDKIHARMDREQPQEQSSFGYSESQFDSDTPSEKWTSSTFGSSETDEEKPKKKKNARWDEPTGDPWNPRTILTFGIISFVPLIGVPLAFNWKRLGRKRWFTDTLMGALGILLILGVLAGGLAYAFIEARTELYPIMGFPLAAALGIALAFNWGLAGLQSKPYKLWDEEGVEAMVKHKYGFTGWFISMPIAAVLFVGGAYVLYGDMLIPQIYENQDLTIQFPAGFNQLDGEYCTQYDTYLCLYRVTTQSGTQLAEATLMTYDLDGFTTGAQIEEYKRPQLMAAYDDVSIVSIEDVVVDGQDIRIRTYKRGNDQCADYRQHMYFVRNGTAYQISAMTTCERLWGRYNEVFDKMLYGMKFH